MKSSGKRAALRMACVGTLIFAVASVALADGVANQQQPLTYLVKFLVTGSPNPDGSFTINGTGYSTITTNTGQVLDNVVPGLKVATLNGAQITFSGQLTDPVVPFTCAPGSCQISIGGSTLEADSTVNPDGTVTGVPLLGRLVPAWGPVNNSNFIPGSVTPMRILGCGGIKDISGQGVFANMVGSICFNGVFNLPTNLMSTPLTGESNCTITMHTPLPGFPLPGY